MNIYKAAFVLVLAASGCGEKGDEDSQGELGGCAGICANGGFTDSEETDFGGGVVECLCKGNGEGVSEEDCDAYCAEELGLAAEDALLTSEVSEDDKCVCDGTGG